MKNDELLKKSNIEDLINFQHNVAKITIDSRNVVQDAIYLCEDSQYLASAIANGAKTIITAFDIFCFNKEKINFIKVKDLKATYALLLKNYYSQYRFPYLIGVTGTCGKTTVSSLIYYSIKPEYNVILFSSNGIYQSIDNDEIILPTNNTTPKLEIIYDKIFSNSFDYAVIEVSSQGIDYGRILGLEFDTAIFLNLSHEHLDHHIQMENYFFSKLQLFKQLKCNGNCIVNQKFKDYQVIFDNVCGKKLLFNSEEVMVKSRNLITQTIIINNEIIETIFNGDYNLENLAAVITTLRTLNIKLDNLIQILRSKKAINGRLNILTAKMRFFIIDYAHTPVETKQLLMHLSKYKRKRLITVIGCGGNRDKLKRKMISKICIELSDFVIFTEDNNRNEMRIKIVNDMLKGVKKNHYMVVLDRVLAVKKAIEISKNDDLVAIVGRGAEQYYDAIHQLMVTDYDVVNLWLSEEK